MYVCMYDYIAVSTIWVLHGMMFRPLWLRGLADLANLVARPLPWADLSSRIEWSIDDPYCIVIGLSLRQEGPNDREISIV